MLITLEFSTEACIVAKNLKFTGWVDDHPDYLPKFIQNFSTLLHRACATMKNSYVSRTIEEFWWRFENIIKRCSIHPEIRDKNSKKIEVGEDRYRKEKLSENVYEVAARPSPVLGEVSAYF